MPRFILAYYDGDTQPGDPTAHREKWMAWLGGLGDAVVNRGTPLGAFKVVSADGIKDWGPNAMVGYTIVRAGGMDAALEMAQDCPYLDVGTIGVAEVKDMP